MRPELTMAVALIVSLSLMGVAAFANDRSGPKGSVGGGSPSGGKGVPQMQAPLDPMQQGGDAKGTPQSGSERGTQNPKEGTDRKASAQNTEKAKERK